MTKRLLVAPGLLLVCVLFYWKLALTDEYVWFDHPDMCYAQIPRLQMIAREVHAGRFPLWDPYIWLGQPLLGQTQPGPVFPLNLLLSLLPLRDGYLDLRWFNWYFVIVRFLAMVCAYALCRELRRSRSASLLAACVFAFAGFVGTVRWIDVPNGAIWTPAICLFFLRAARGRRRYANAALSGAFLGLAWLSGHHEVPTLVSFALAAGWCFVLWRRRLPAIAPAMLTFVIAGMIGAVQIWPTLEFGMLSRRWAGLPEPSGWSDPIPYSVPAHYSLPVTGLTATFIYELVLHADATLFVGVVAMSLALYAIAARWRLPPVRWMTVLAGIALVYALGSLTPLHGLLYSYVPLLGKSRIPVRALHLFNFGIVILAAYGLDVLIRGRERVWSRRLFVGLMLLAAAVFVGLVWRVEMTPHRVIAGIVAALAGVAIRLRAPGALLVLAIVEIYPAVTGSFTSRYNPSANRFVNALQANRDIAAFLHGEPGLVRVDVNEQDVPLNFGDWHGLATLGGFVAGATANVVSLPRHVPEVQRKLAVSHYLAREAGRPDQVDVFSGASGLKVFRNPDALPRARGVPESCAAAPVEVLAYAPNRVRLRARMNCPGKIVLSDTFYPGWRAFVDGRETTISEVEGALRGVTVEGGEHEIEFHYRPLSVYGGAALTFGGLLAVVVIVLIDLSRATASIATARGRSRTRRGRHW
jgi:hypothetical protein